jgi:hypothetical protein
MKKIIATTAASGPIAKKVIAGLQKADLESGLAN